MNNSKIVRIDVQWVKPPDTVTPYQNEHAKNYKVFNNECIKTICYNNHQEAEQHT